MELPAASARMEWVAVAGSAACRQPRMLDHLAHHSHTDCFAHSHHWQEGTARPCRCTGAASPGKVQRERPSQQRVVVPEERDLYLPDAATQAAHLRSQDCP